MNAGVQVFVYPEELRFVSPEQLAAQVVELGCAAVSVSLAYHRARRVFPRHGHVSVLTESALYFEPNRARYGALVPVCTADRELQDALLAFREACDAAGIRFRAWLVALHHEGLARQHPGAAAYGPDGAPVGHSLCPSAPEAVEYVAALAADAAAQFRPEAIDLEAWLYPAWEPSYTLTLALEPPAPDAERHAMHCSCAHCRALLEEAAGDLAHARSAGAARLAGAVAGAVRDSGASLRLFGSGPPEQARFQGLSAEAATAADAMLLGCGRLAGDELDARFAGLREVIGGGRATVSTNWTPERTPESMAEDVSRLAAAGADGLSLYNLSLVPAAGLEAFRAAATAFRGVPAS